MVDIVSFFIFGPGAYGICIAIGVASHRPCLAALRHISRLCVGLTLAGLNWYLDIYSRSLRCVNGVCIDMFGRAYPDGSYTENEVIDAILAEPSGEDAPMFWDSPATAYAASDAQAEDSE